MKRTVLALSLALFAAVSSAINPITYFPWANYLGQGDWLNDAGATGTFASYVTFYGNGWNTAQYRDGVIYLYESVLNIDQYGFFTAQVTDSSNPSNPINYTGYGNCGTTVCQMTVALSNGTLQKAWHFGASNNSIQSVGAIYFNDGTPNMQWEENIAVVPALQDATQAGE